MPSSETKGISQLIERGPVHPVLLCNLIETRRRLIKPHLDTFTLQELGNFRFLESTGLSTLHGLNQDKPSIGSGSEIVSVFKTQGVFFQGCISVKRERPASNNYKKYIAGLSRSGDWLLIEVKITYDPKCNYEWAKEVTVLKPGLERIVFSGLGISYEGIWSELGRTIKGWLSSRKRLYEIARGIAKIIEIEDLLLQLR